MMRPPPKPPLFPYTTLFRSGKDHARLTAHRLRQSPAGGHALAGGRLPVTGHQRQPGITQGDRKSTRLNSSHVRISYAVFCLKKKKVHSSWIAMRQLDPRVGS